MFRTVQSAPGIITLFNSSKGSSKLLKTLQLASQPTSHPTQEGISEKPRSLWSYVTKGKEESHHEPKFVVEELVGLFPTYDQLKLMKSCALADKGDQFHVFSSVFPKFVDGDSIRLPDEQESDVDFRTQSFDFLVKDGIFKPPLVVDWEQGKLANDEGSLQRLLKAYN